MVIATVSNESNMGRGTVGATGGEGLLDSPKVKPLHVVDETFCSIPTYGANCHYLDRLTSGALAARCKPVKKGVRRWCAGRLSDD